TAAVKHGQLAAETLQHHLRGIALLPRLVGPFARLQRALDVDLAAFLQIFLRHLRQALVEDHDAVPLGALAPLTAVLVAPGLGGGKREIYHLGPLLRAADLRVATEIADENNLVDRTSHVTLREIMNRCQIRRI